MFKQISIAALLTGGIAGGAFAASPLAKVYTGYTSANGSSISWTTCGTLPNSSGCFGSGSLASLSNACAVIESGSVMATTGPSGYSEVGNLYVLNAGTTANGATLNTYKKTDTLAGSYVTTTITLLSQTKLPLVGGPGVTCQLAGNANALFLGTNKSKSAVKVAVASLAVSAVPGFSDGAAVSRISTNEAGFVAVVFGTGATAGYYVFGPDGSMQSDGGGGPWFADAHIGIQLTPGAQ